MKKPKTERAHVELIALTDPGEAQAVEIMLMPWGNVQSVKGDFVVDEESARLIAQAFVSGKKDIPIDFEHTTVGGNFSTPSGAAPASGWITTIYAKAGQGIYAMVKWNDAARAMIKADEYRYLSPVVVIRKADRKAVAVDSAALTNKPAIVDMERVAAKETEPGDDTMNYTELKAALIAAGVPLADDVEGDDILNAAKAFVESAAKKTAEPPPLSAIAAKLGLDKSATEEVIVAKVGELTVRPSAEEYKAVTGRLEALELRDKDRASQELVACAIEAAKLNPNDEKQMAWARTFAKTDQIAFKAWSEAAPALYSAGRVVTPSAKLDGGDTRQTTIQAAKAEYGENREKLHGIEAASFVNAALSMKGLELLTADEKKALTV